MENPALKNGLIGGGICALLTILLGFVSPEAYIKWMSSLPYVVIIVFMVLATRQQKEFNGGMLSFGDGFVAAFVSMSIAMAIWQIVVFLQYNFIQPELNEMAKQIAIEAMDTMSGMFSGMLGNDGVEAMDMAMEQAKEDLLDKEQMISIGATIANYFISLIVGAIISLIIAAVMKSSNA